MEHRVTLTRPAATDTLASPALDQVLDEYATAIEALSATHVIKRVTAALSGAMSGTGRTWNTSSLDLNTRFLFAFPVTPTRWRLRLRNYSALNSASSTGTGDATVTAFHGTPTTPATTDWRWNGGLAATATQITFGGASSTTISGENEIVSDWVTNANYDAGRNVVFSIAATAVSATFVAAGADSVGGLSKAASGAAAAASTANGGGYTFSASTAAVYFDTRVEYEYETDVLPSGRVRNPVILFIGDSITAGHVQSQFSSSGPYNFKTDTFPEQVGLRHGYGIVNAGVGQSRVQQSPISGTNSGWDQVTTTDHNYLVRFDLATTIPDECVIMLGTNDCGAATRQTKQSIIDAYGAVINNVRAWGINRIHVCTIVPGGYGSPLTYTASAGNNDTVLTGISDTALLTAGLPVAGTSIPSSTFIDAILSPTSVSISNATTGVISAGSLTFGDTTPDYSAAAAETLRQQLNAWIRTKPGLVTSVFDVADALEGPLPGMAIGVALPHYPHPHLRGFSMIANAIDL